MTFWEFVGSFIRSDFGAGFLLALFISFLIDVIIAIVKATR